MLCRLGTISTVFLSFIVLFLGEDTIGFDRHLHYITNDTDTRFECGNNQPNITKAFCVGRKSYCPLESVQYKLLPKSRSQECRKKHCCVHEVLPPPQEGRCGLSYFSDEEYRIVGGQASIPGQWPWIVSIELSPESSWFTRAPWQHACGGVLIQRQMVLTAAHCFKDTNNPADFRVVLGQHDKHVREHYNVYRNVEIILSHEEFESPTPGANDIALLLLEDPVEYTEYIQPICLPHRQYTHSHKSLRCYIIGFGLVNKRANRMAKTLRHAPIKIYDHKTCYQSERTRYRVDTNLCGGGTVERRGKTRTVDACQGDSGGPLACITYYHTWMLVGIVSWGRGCGNPHAPGFYTSVYPYLEWINSAENDINAYLNETKGAEGESETGSTSENESGKKKTETGGQEEGSSQNLPLATTAPTIFGETSGLPITSMTPTTTATTTAAAPKPTAKTTAATKITTPTTAEATTITTTTAEPTTTTTMGKNWNFLADLLEQERERNSWENMGQDRMNGGYWQGMGSRREPKGFFQSGGFGGFFG